MTYYSSKMLTVFQIGIVDCIVIVEEYVERVEGPCALGQQAIFQAHEQLPWITRRDLLMHDLAFFRFVWHARLNTAWQKQSFWTPLALDFHVLSMLLLLLLDMEAGIDCGYCRSGMLLLDFVVESQRRA